MDTHDFTAILLTHILIVGYIDKVWGLKTNVKVLVGTSVWGSLEFEEGIFYISYACM